jgi:hypothetical protein
MVGTYHNYLAIILLVLTLIEQLPINIAYILVSSCIQYKLNCMISRTEITRFSKYARLLGTNGIISDGVLVTR